MNGLLLSFKNAFRGIWIAFKGQRNQRIHFVLGFATILAGFYFHISKVEWLAILLSISLVMGLEIMNTAIEELTDHISPDFHEKVGRVKDLAAGSVLIASLFVFILGLVIFLPRLLAIIGSIFHA